MDQQLIRVLIGTVTLLIIALLPVRRETGSRRAYLGMFIGLAGAFGIASLFLHLGDFVLDDGGESLVHSQIRVIQHDQKDHIPKNLVIIEGSSQTALGLDNAAVESYLRQAGYDASVVQLDGEGATHIGRYTLISRFLTEMRRHGLALSPNTRLMLEMSPGYDLDPLRFLGAIKDTPVGLNNASFGNMAFTVENIRLLHQPFTPATFAVLGGMFQNTLISELHIGLVLDMQRFDTLGDVSPFSPLKGQNRAYKFDTYAPHRFVDAPPEPFQAAWLDFDTNRVRRLTALFDGKLTEADYFAVPTATNDGLMAYAHSFCVLRGKAPCIDAADSAVWGRLDSSGYYWNRDHLSAAGAPIFTRYFAEQLIAQGMVVK